MDSSSRAGACTLAHRRIVGLRLRRDIAIESFAEVVSVSNRDHVFKIVSVRFEVANHLSGVFDLPDLARWHVRDAWICLKGVSRD